MSETQSFGQWLRHRRKELDLTQSSLAHLVGCAQITIRKLEADQMRPSRQLTKLLVAQLEVPFAEQPHYERLARQGSRNETAITSNTLHQESPIYSAQLVSGTERGHPNNLPQQLPAFIGRTVDIEEICQRVRRHRLVTLMGSGGIGKTRLALKVAEKMLESFPDGVFLVEMSRLFDPGLMPQVCLQSLGMIDETGQPPAEILQQFLKNKDFLLLLDNCDHVIAACTLLVKGLLNSCPELKILVTSREILGVPGESSYQVSAMKVPDRDKLARLDDLVNVESIQYFLKRASLVSPGLDPNEGDLKAIAQICRRLDGNPRAIELVAALVGVLSVEAIAARLDEWSFFQSGNHWVGRGPEFIEANLLWQQAISGVGNVLLLNGDAGVGKTRFTRELAAVARRSGAHVMEAECYPEGGASFAPLTRMIRDTLINSALADLRLPDEILTALSPVLPSRFTSLPRINPPETLYPWEEQQRIFEGFFVFCTTLSAAGPLLLILDDIHWADSGTLFLMKNLAREGRKLPLLIVMTYREAELESAQVLTEILVDFNRQRLAIELKLEPFNRRETGDLLAAIFSEEITSDFLDEIYTQTEGNPFFVEEVCKGLVETGLVTFQNGRWQRPPMQEIPIPATVRAAIQTRIKKLPQSSQDALCLAAIFGREFDFQTLRYALDIDEDSLIQSLESALRAKIIVEVQAGNEAEGHFAFVHALIPSSLREGMIQIRRQRLHVKAAQAIETIHPQDYEILAYHFAAGGEPARAAEYYRRAGDRTRTAAPADAILLYRKALEYWPIADIAEQAEITAHLANTLWWIGEVQAALQCFEDAYMLYVRLENRTQCGEMQRMLGRLEWEMANRTRSMQHYQKALELLDQGLETPELARAVSSISQAYMLEGENDLAIEWGQRAAAMAERLSAKDVIAQALNNIGTALASAGDVEKGIGILNDSLQRSLQFGLIFDASRAYTNIESVLQLNCRYLDARETMQDLLVYANKVHSPKSATIAIRQLVWTDWLTGQWRSALSYRSMLAYSSNTLSAIWISRIYGMIDLDLGRVEEGLRLLEESLPGALQANDAQTTGPHLGELIRAYAALGQEAKSLEMIRRLLEHISGRAHLSNNSIMPLFYACQLLSNMVKADLEFELAACLGQLERHVSRYSTGEAEAALAEARGCLSAEVDPPAAAEFFRRAAAGWESISRPYDRARALASLGYALEASGERSAARAAWDEALRIYGFLAGQLDADTQSTFLNSSIVKTVRQSAEGTTRQKRRQEMSVLSEREIAVLKLVAEGLSNNEIATRLFLSPLTVNAHLRSIFNKLNVSNRTAAVHHASALKLI